MIRFAAYVVAAAVAAGAQALQISDDRGVAISLARPTQRIVSLAPHLAEIAFAAGAGAKLVGVSRPDLVLAWRSGNSPLQIARLERLGFRVFVTEVRSLADIPRVVRLVGALAGSADVAEGRARQFENEIEDLRRRHAGERRVAAFLEIWHRPMLTVNGTHLMSDALGLCGGRNVFAAAKTLTPVVSREQVLDARPEAIVTGGFGSEAPQAWRGLEPVPAVRNLRIYAIDPDVLYGQGPHVLEGVR